MSSLAIFLLVTFVLGLFARMAKLPPMVGFLAAGFVLYAIDVPPVPGLGTLADIGVTLLLFTIGLKLDLRSLLKREIWLTATTHMAASVLLVVFVLWMLGLLGVPRITGQDMSTLALLGFALSFSSTVFVIKVLQDRGESQSLYGRIAIGVLVMQDIAAVIFVTATNEKPPSAWAVTLILILPVRELAHAIAGRLGHGELMIVFGAFMALVPGYTWFDAVGLKGDLGALIMGVVMASHPAASELSKSLFSIKELFLVAFFLSIGLGGIPTPGQLVLGIALLAFLPLQAYLYMLLLWSSGLRPRTAVMTSTLLTNYSEFGLIVVALGVEAGMISNDWLLVLSVSVAGSFVFAAITSNRRVPLLGWLEKRLPDHPPHKVHPEDRLIEIGDADAVVMGLGRVGRVAYDQLVQVYGLKVLGVEANVKKVESLTAEGRNVVEGDATDRLFWDRLCSGTGTKIAVLALPYHANNLVALAWLQSNHYQGKIASVARYENERIELRDKGADLVLNLFDGAGVSLGDKAARVAGIKAVSDEEVVVDNS